MYCVAVKTNSNMWEMGVRHREHNHGPVEPPVKKKKGIWNLDRAQWTHALTCT